MTGLTLQPTNNLSFSPLDPMSDTGSGGGINAQQLAQFIQELLALLQAILPSQNNDDLSSPPAGGAGGGAGGAGGGYSPPPVSGGAPAGGAGGQPAPAPAAGGATPPAGGATPPAGGATPPAGGATPPAGQTPPVGSTGNTPPSGGSAPGLSTNAGGVAQASAVSGVSPASTQTMNTGTGDDKVFNVTNNTSRPESFTYSVQGANKATMTLQPGQTGTFTAGSGDIGVRISPSDAQGNTRPNEVLYEDGGADNGQAAGAGNPDVSKVDGDKDYGGNDENMTITLSDGRTAGDGDAIRAYMNPTDDAAAMGLAGDPSKTVNITMSDR